MTKSGLRSRGWTTTAGITGIVLALAMTGALPAAANAPDRQRTEATRTHEPLDVPALKAALSGLPDANVSGALMRISGRDGRWTGISGTSVPSPDAHFRIGSITKIFTSTVVLQLTGEGRLSLDDTVQKLMPGLLPPSYSPITVGQLLSHTSGLPIPVCAKENVPPREVVDSALSCGTPTEPGATTQYNGINYFILGLLIEKVTGHSYGHEVRTRILHPLNLHDTTVPALDDWSIPAPYTRGAVIHPGSDELTDVSVQSPWSWAEGGMISNAPDLSRFFTALYQGRLLPPAQQRHLFTLPNTPGEKQFSYAGLQRTELPDGTVVWGKSGSYPGYTSGVFATRDLRRILVYSLNPTGRAPELPYVMRMAGAAF